MKASFGQRDIPLFHSLMKEYTTENIVENARKSLKTVALGYNTQNIYEDTLETSLAPIATALNSICLGLEKDANCDFFKKEKIFFSDFHSFNSALNVITVFKSTPNKPYGLKANRFICNDLFNVLSIFVGIHNYSKPRVEEEPDLSERKRPTLREISYYDHLFIGDSKYVLSTPTENDPLLNCYKLIKSGFQTDSISQEDFDSLHLCFERMLLNGWNYHYNHITAAFGSKTNMKQYNAVLKKLELLNGNSINVNMIGRNTRQVNTIDSMHTFSDQSDYALIAQLQGFFSNMNSLYLCYCYLTDRVIRQESESPYVSDVMRTFTCGYCGKQFGSYKAVVADHKILSNYISGEVQKVACPGKKHPPLEVANTGLRLRSQVERSAYQSAQIELSNLDSAKELCVEGKYSMHVFTPKDLSWNTRLAKAKDEQAKKVEKLKDIFNATEEQIKGWVQTPISSIPTWVPKKPKEKITKCA